MMREMGCQMDVGLGQKCEITGLYMDTRKDKMIKPYVRKGLMKIDKKLRITKRIESGIMKLGNWLTYRSKKGEGWFISKRMQNEVDE